MTDKQFEGVIRRTALAYNKYIAALEQAETEYERRYGFNPSEVDDDYWIDSLHGGAGRASPLTVEEVNESVKIRKIQK